MTRPEFREWLTLVFLYVFDVDKSENEVCFEFEMGEHCKERNFNLNFPEIFIALISQVPEEMRCLKLLSYSDCSYLKFSRKSSMTKL